MVMVYERIKKPKCTYRVERPTRTRSTQYTVATCHVRVTVPRGLRAGTRRRARQGMQQAPLVQVNYCIVPTAPVLVYPRSPLAAPLDVPFSTRS